MIVANIIFHTYVQLVLVWRHHLVKSCKIWLSFETEVNLYLMDEVWKTNIIQIAFDMIPNMLWSYSFNIQFIMQIWGYKIWETLLELIKDYLMFICLICAKRKKKGGEGNPLQNHALIKIGLTIHAFIAYDYIINI